MDFDHMVRALPVSLKWKWEGLPGVQIVEVRSVRMCGCFSERFDGPRRFSECHGNAGQYRNVQHCVETLETGARRLLVA